MQEEEGSSSEEANSGGSRTFRQSQVEIQVPQQIGGKSVGQQQNVCKFKHSIAGKTTIEIHH